MATDAVPAADGGAAAASGSGGGSCGDNERVTFKYVFIPADPTQPLEERTLTTTKEDECLSLINECKKHFRCVERAAAAAARAPPLLLVRRQQFTAHSLHAFRCQTLLSTCPPSLPNPRLTQATSDASRAAHREALLKSAGANAAAVPEAALQAALSMQMVESVPLMANAPDTGFVAVNM